MLMHYHTTIMYFRDAMHHFQSNRILCELYQWPAMHFVNQNKVHPMQIPLLISFYIDSERH